ncbi:MAG: NYN domain-containing protein, partial [Sulfuritalea sp.]|nr:NYN domain-containing protein [Sulfuritalea sp.]
GDSDFSPLVSKLRENNKRVIGVGVKAATSDLLAANCDEFIFYDDLVRELPAKKQRSERKAAAKPASAAAKPKSEEKTEDRKRQEAIDLVVETVEALVTERGEDEKIWGSMVKQTLKRRKPGFSESYYGYRSFGELLEDAMKHKLLTLERDEKSGQHIIRLPADD